MTPLLVVVLTAGCAAASAAGDGRGADPAPPSTTAAEAAASRTLRIPVRETPVGGLVRTASLSGRLEGQVGEGETACLWIDSSAGRRVLVWPAGYRAAADPLRVLDPDGRTVVTVGDQVTSAGGVQIRPPADTEALAACGDYRSLWGVDHISRRS